MPRRGRPAQGHAPAEGLAQYDMAPLFVADAERRTQALGATRMVVEWLVNRGTAATVALPVCWSSGPKPTSWWLCNAGLAGLASDFCLLVA